MKTDLKLPQLDRPPRASRSVRAGANVGVIERDLRDAVDGEIRFDTTTRAAYSTDGSNYRQIPIGVIIPKSVDAIVAAMEVCHHHGVPVLGRGCGTSLAGQCTNTAVIFDLSKYLNRTLEIDPQRKLARVQPGTILDHLRVPAEREHRLTFGPDPATHSHCTLGGMIGNNSCGVHSVVSGRTADNVEELEVLTYDGLRMRVGPTSENELDHIIAEGGRRGEIYEGLRNLRDEYAHLIRERYPDIPRRVSGYNLTDLLPENGFNVAKALVGTESTCAMTLEATLNLIDWPPYRSLLLVGCSDVYAAADQVPLVLEHNPNGLEGIDEKLVSFMRRKHLHPKDVSLLPDGNGWLLVEFGGSTLDEADQRARELMSSLDGRPNVCDLKLFDDPGEVERVWEIRESGLGATAYVPSMRDSWPGWEDAAVAPEKVGDYLRDFRKLLDRYNYDCALYGHFGDGCIHCRITFDLVTHHGVERYRSFIEDAADLVVSHGGSLSGEHGDGQARGVLLEKMYGPELIRAFRRFKRIWDPDYKMNPGKVIDADDPTEHLKLGSRYHPEPTATHFAYPEDGGSFSHAALRCVGVGKCRRTHDAFMCPSFMATRDEKDSTRGRARVLFEMLQGDIVKDKWRDDAVQEALDLCVGCKGCKSECPVDVDMATYKSEYLAHHYHRRLRPRSHYAMGLIDRWAKLARFAPRLANFFGQTAPFSRVAKALAGVAPERALPAFASPTFSQSHPPTPARVSKGKRVIFLADVFNDNFFPESLHAAVNVLEHYGFTVDVRQIPAIRPRIHYGMLRKARAQLWSVLEMLAPYVRHGTDVVAIEPSTVSLFRDELQSFFPNDADAIRIRQHCMLLSEFLDSDGSLPLPSIGGRAVFHAHCHQKAILNKKAARNILARMGIDVTEPEQGCCGMAGSFGYEAGEHYRVSQTIAEQNLWPTIRAADADTRIIIEGFSCREQIMHGTGRCPEHLAELIASGLGLHA